MAPSPTSSYIVADLWPDILKKVTDVKALCRFRCVSRSWCSLLSSRRFFADHATAAMAKPVKAYIFFDFCHSIKPNTSRVGLYHPQATPGQQIWFLHFPFEDSKYGFEISDVVHGVVFLHNYRASILWIPIIRKYIHVPWYPGQIGKMLIYHGLGFDSSKNEFKAVRLFYSDSRSLKLQKCAVFSFKDHQWRNVSVPDCHLAYIPGGNGFFMNDSIHWTVGVPVHGSRFKLRPALLVFDCITEELRRMDFPGELRPLHSRHRLLNYGGMLALFVSITFEFWVMEEYGVASSWKKLPQIDEEDLICNEDNVVFLLGGGMKKTDNVDVKKEWLKCHEEMKSLHLWVLVLEETMFFSEAKSKALSYGKEEIISKHDWMNGRRSFIDRQFVRARISF